MPQVVRLLNQVFSPTLDADGRRALDNMGQTPPFLLRLQQFGARLAPGFVWEDDGAIVGNVSIIPTKAPGRVIIANVAVAPTHRRQGIAWQLMETTLNHLRANGMRVVVLQVDVHNTAAALLYERLGFDLVGSTAYWTAAPSQWHELAVAHEPPIQPLRADEYRAAYEVDCAGYPLDLNWPDPITRNQYRRGILERLDDFLNGRQCENWAVHDVDGRLLALAGIWSEWGRPHRLTVRVPAALRNELSRPLLAKLLRRLRYLHSRHVSIEHPLDDAVMHDLLSAANFRARRQLATMKLTL